jgi:SpoVK/Ycf46/Vps4 family AAA+-type ATPase
MNAILAGTGKTMLVKAVARHTTAAFIRVVGSEFVQKYLGEGPRMVRDVFRLARENAPAIIFIDEIDAIATKRFDAQTGADREVQRILLELLNQMDGFDQGSNVKVSTEESRLLYNHWSIVFVISRSSWLQIVQTPLILLYSAQDVSTARSSSLFLPDAKNVSYSRLLLAK